MFKDLPVDPVDGQRGYGYVAVHDAIGVQGQVVFVLVNAFSVGHIQAVLPTHKIVGIEVTALTADADALHIAGDIHIVKIVFFEDKWIVLEHGKRGDLFLEDYFGSEEFPEGFEFKKVELPE